MKTVLKLGIGAFFLIITIIGASAMEFDTLEDSFILHAGESRKGAFILISPEEQVFLASDFEWISLSEQGDVYTIENARGKDLFVGGGMQVFNYYITVPDDADVGVYRGIITANSDQVLNIKISVQKKPISAIMNFLGSKLGSQILSVSLIIILVLMASFMMGGMRS